MQTVTTTPPTTKTTRVRHKILNITMEDPPPGFRFYPTEEELVSFYLQKQLQGQSHHINRVIPVIDINGVEPWNLPSKLILYIYSGGSRTPG